MFTVIPWRQKYLDIIWEAGLPSEFFKNKTQLLNLIRAYRNHFQAEVYIIAKDQQNIALLFIESVFLDKKTLVGNLLQLNSYDLQEEQDIQKILLQIGASFYRLERNFEQLILRIPDKTQKVIPGNEPATFLGNSVYPNKLEMRQFAAADFNPENFIIFRFKGHFIAVKILNDKIINVLFLPKNKQIQDDSLRKALLRGCFLNDQGLIETDRELIKIHSLLRPLNAGLEIAIIQQFTAYFTGQAESFDLPYELLYGTDFQKQVWQIIREIPYGSMLSYQEVALKLTGDPKKASGLARAVGSACGKNPLGLIIPCHRVIGKDRTLTGFSGGVELKSALLDLEFMHRTNY